ncbi:MAG: hypothetical protein F6K58_05230 [Symploca sp. SIO2E9]|nr:hypothetical protein [Symploca sp. SIO2E9]
MGGRERSKASFPQTTEIAMPDRQKLKARLLMTMNNEPGNSINQESPCLSVTARPLS